MWNSSVSGGDSYPSGLGGRAVEKSEAERVGVASASGWVGRAGEGVKCDVQIASGTSRLLQEGECAQVDWTQGERRQGGQFAETTEAIDWLAGEYCQTQERTDPCTYSTTCSTQREPGTQPCHLKRLTQTCSTIDCLVLAPIRRLESAN